MFLSTSCVATKAQKAAFIAKHCPTASVKDSSSVKETKTVEKQSFDSTIWISEHGPKVTIIYPCDSVKPNTPSKPIVKKEKKNGITETITIDHGVITAECDVDSLKEVIKGLNTRITEKDSVIKFHSEVKVVKMACELEHRTGLDHFAKVWLFISILLIILALGWKYRKFWLKI